MEKVDSQTENFNQKLRDYSSKEETNALRDRLEAEFATKKDIRSLKMAYTPLIETCQRTLRENQRDNADMKEILLKFDKTMATKADRINTIETHKWVTDNFLSLKASDHNTLQAKEQTQQLECRIAELRSIIDLSDTQVKAKVSKLVSEDLTIRMRKYDSVV